jgi:hypothetical protein
MKDHATANTVTFTKIRKLPEKYDAALSVAPESQRMPLKAKQTTSWTKIKILTLFKRQSLCLFFVQNLRPSV